MGIRFRCHHCESELHVKDFQAGKRGRCPECKGKFRIPTADAEHSIAVEEEWRTAAEPTVPAAGESSKDHESKVAAAGKSEKGAESKVAAAG
ncbi:MAG: hypothetical protein KDA45_08235, partial [Planctomycetales bacterium]|nr:hypothetical protein [Planctomycetales bacterium]